MKQEGFPCTGKYLDRWARVRAVESQKIGQSRDLEGRKQRKLPFSAHKNLMDCSFEQTVGSGNQEKHMEAPWCRGWAGGAKRGAAYKPLQHTQTAQPRGQARELKEEQTSPTT